MRNKIALVIVIILIVSAIAYMEFTKPRTERGNIDADIRLDPTQTDSERVAQKAQLYEQAKELVQPEGYINVENITIAENIGKKVILIDFWTYSCINCQRTLPYLTSWNEKYADEGLLIIGVHTPEFDFEKDYDNVVAATKRWDITYPVVQDNDRQIWRAYNNRYWPRKYLIDIDGFITYDHIGEGAYAETEAKIQGLLQERSEVLGLQQAIESDVVTHPTDKGESSGRTPEIYFGYGFAKEQLGNEEGWRPGEIVNYTQPETKEKNLFYLDQAWLNEKDDMQLISDQGTISLSYHAKSINIVAGAAEPVKLDVIIDGQQVQEITIKEHDLYPLHESAASQDHTVELRAEQGFKAYTFTFG